jgi:lipoprotein-anchoring transpeptidase ErfK/SrfK
VSDPGPPTDPNAGGRSTHPLLYCIRLELWTHCLAVRHPEAASRRPSQPSNAASLSSTITGRTGQRCASKCPAPTRIADTPPGTYQILRQIDGVREAPLGRLYRPKYFTTTGIAFHGYPSVLAFPASHGCVRVTNAAIDFIWSQGLMPLGTTVWVY